MAVTVKTVKGGDDLHPRGSYVVVEDGHLFVRAARTSPQPGPVVAIYAPGHWSSSTVEPNGAS